MGDPVESLDEFLDNLGKKPNMQTDWDKKSYDSKTAALLGQIVEEPKHIVDATIHEVKKNLAIDTFPVGKVLKPGTTTTNQQQKVNIGVIAYALVVQGYKITAEEIYDAWPSEGDAYKLARAGKRPSINAIQDYLGTPAFLDDMAQRGVEFAESPGGLSDEQIALLNILTDTSTNINLGARLRKAGVKPSTFKVWKRQRAFSEALNRITQVERQDAADMVDLALIAKAQSGDLRAIMYFNDLVGRGPNDKKAVDAMQFSKVVLEAVMQVVKDPAMLKEISARIEIASKQLGS